MAPNENCPRHGLSWIAQANMLLEDTDARTYSTIMTSIGQQIITLKTTWRNAPDGVPRMVCLIALMLSDLAVAGHDRQLHEAQSALVAQPRAPFKSDTWDGYPAAREAILASARRLDKNLVVLAGDSHNAWASDLKDATGAAVGVEFATPSVTSTGLEVQYSRIGHQFLADAFLQMVPDLRYAQTSDRGYLLITLFPTQVRADWVLIGSVFSKDPKSRVGRSLATRPGTGGRRIEEV